MSFNIQSSLFGSIKAGRFGNQFFQLFTAIAYAIEHNEKMVIPTLKWDEKVRRMIAKEPSLKNETLEYCLELKIDGLKVILTYKNGSFTPPISYSG